MKKVKVGYFSLVKGSWINDRLAGQRTDALNMLNSLDIELVDCGDLIQNEAQAAEAIRAAHRSRRTAPVQSAPACVCLVCGSLFHRDYR